MPGLPSTLIPGTQQGRCFLLCTWQRSSPRPPAPAPTRQETRGCLGATFIVLSLCPGRRHSRRWVIYTYTHMYTHCPHLQQRRRQPCLKGQQKCSFCQFHRRRNHNQNSKTGESCVTRAHSSERWERSDISHCFTPLTTTAAPRAVPLAGCAESQGRTDRAPPGRAHEPVPAPLTGGLTPGATEAARLPSGRCTSSPGTDRPRLEYARWSRQGPSPSRSPVDTARLRGPSGAGCSTRRRSRKAHARAVTSTAG